jgi:hypothetical protein
LGIVHRLVFHQGISLSTSRQPKRTPAEKSPHLDVSCSPIEIEVQVFYLPELGKLVGHILFRGFLVYIGDEDDPPLDSYN